MSDIDTPVRATLGYRDARAAIRFLVEALGFRVGVVHDDLDSPDVIYHAVLHWPGGGLVTLHSVESTSIGDLSEHVAAEADYPPFAMHIDIEDPDPVYEQAVSVGAKVVRPLQDSPHGVGTRGFIVSDPEGLYWSVGTPLPHLARDPDGTWRPTGQ